MPDYYLQPQVVGLPPGLPPLRHNPQADGRHVFWSETDDMRVWVEPKAQAWSRPGLYKTEPPMDAFNPVSPGALTGPNRTTNFGVNVGSLRPHANKIETNDPHFVPPLGSATSSPVVGQQVPLPLDAEGKATMPTGMAVMVAVVLAIVILASALRGGKK